MTRRYYRWMEEPEISSTSTSSKHAVSFLGAIGERYGHRRSAKPEQIPSSLRQTLRASLLVSTSPYQVETSRRSAIFVVVSTNVAPRNVELTGVH